MLYALLGILIYAVDMLTKHWAATELMPLGTIPLIQDVFHLTYVENHGIAFGLFAGGRVLWAVVALLIVLALGWFLLKTKNRSFWLKLALALIFPGALGNVTDRVLRGYVVDFLDFRAIQFPVFNVADIAVCIGAALLMLHFFLTDEKVEEEKRDDLA